MPIRRPTGGGLVDHLNDWTYALVIPHTHWLFRERAASVYTWLHKTLLKVFEAHGCTALLQLQKNDSAKAFADVCFEAPQVSDVVNAQGEKLAGAAQKRNKQGLLIQGSINRQAVGFNLDEQFECTFSRALASELRTQHVFKEDFRSSGIQMEKLTTLFASPEWNKMRKRDLHGDRLI